MKAHTNTGLYNFEVAFFAPVSRVIGPEADLRQVVSEQIKIPDDHIFALGQTAVLTKLERPEKFENYVGDVTFVDWKGDNPSARVATIYVDICRPGFLSRVGAFISRREPNASVHVAAYGSEPLGGGEPVGAPDDMPLPNSPVRELAMSGK